MTRRERTERGQGLVRLPMRNEQPLPRSFLVLILAALVLLAFVVRPVVTELLLAAVIAGVLWPLQQLLTRRVRKRGIAAGILTVGVVLLLLGPIAAMATFIIRDGNDGVRFVSDAARSPEVADLVAYLPEAARDVVSDALARVPRSIGEIAGSVDSGGGDTAAAVGAALAATGTFAFHGALMVVALFFFLVRGHEVVGWLAGVSPLGREPTEEILATFKKVSFAVIVSAAVTAGVQALAALVGFFIAQVPNPVFFALVTFFMAFIPAIGAAAVVLIAALLLLATGHPYMALFLGLWGVLVVGLVDNLVKPLLIRRGLEIHGAVVFFALIGGIATFGAIGLLVGPLAVALFLAVLRIYHRDYTPGDPRLPAVPGLRDADQPSG